MISFGVLLASLVIGGVGLFVALFLGAAGISFAVPVDEKETEIRELLPGANCGACGFSGCSALAAAIAKGDAPVNQCPVGGSSTTEAIAKVMGATAEEGIRMVARVRCAGDCENTKDLYDYSGTKGCMEAQFAPNGGAKSCRFGCTGFGDCVDACEFGAIRIKNGIADVDEDRCVDCRKCIAACPKGLIAEVPADKKAHIDCVNPNKGKPVMDSCMVGCISCQKCVRECPVTAIAMGDGYPVIDYEKCINCGKCVRECPRHCIL